VVAVAATPVWVGWTGAAPAAARAEPPKLTAASTPPINMIFLVFFNITTPLVDF
jgi:hypothetical protein